MSWIFQKRIWTFRKTQVGNFGKQTKQKQNYKIILLRFYQLWVDCVRHSSGGDVLLNIFFKMTIQVIDLQLFSQFARHELFSDERLNGWIFISTQIILKNERILLLLEHFWYDLNKLYFKKFRQNYKNTKKNSRTKPAKVIVWKIKGKISLIN